MSEAIKIAAAQIDIAYASPDENVERFESALREAQKEGARLVIFPECALTGYVFETRQAALGMAQTVPGPSTMRLAQTCRQLDMFCIVGLLEHAGDKLYNACALIGPDGVIGNYRKVHLPYLGIDRFVDPGDGFSVWDAAGLKVGMNICYDGSFPESARCMALAGADLIALPTNWPPGSECTAEHLICSRAMENTLYYAAVNRVGEEAGFPFIGNSIICGPNGAILASAPHTDEVILYADVDPALARRKQLVRVPGLHEINRFADRRPDTYGRIVEPVSPEHLASKQISAPEAK